MLTFRCEISLLGHSVLRSFQLCGRYPRNLPAGSATKVLVCNQLDFLANSAWSLFYIASTPSKFASDFSRVYHTHVTAMRSDSDDVSRARSWGWTRLDKRENSVLRFAADGAAVSVASRVVVSGHEYRHDVMMSFLGGLDFASTTENPPSVPKVEVIDGWKYGFSKKGNALCPVPGCKSTTGRTTFPALQEHFRAVHRRLKLHRCDMCKQTFSFAATLKRHVQNIHVDSRKKRFHCSVCDKGFARSDGLKAHMQRFHQE